MSQSFDQPIAEAAMRLVQAVPQAQQDEYKAACESLAAYLRRAGLARTLAFLQGKKDAQRLLAQHIEEQFKLVVPWPQGTLMQSHLKADLNMYRAHVEIAQRVALWHKRMAQALFPKKAA